MLTVISEFIDEVPPLAVDGIFGSSTENAVRSIQRWLGLPVTGVVDEQTWDEIYDQFSGIENTALRDGEAFPSSTTNGGRNSTRTRYARSTTMTQFPGNNLQTGDRDPVRQEVIR
jgi:hypothetical protein